MVQVLICGLPASRSPRFDVSTVHLVDFLETKASRLWDEEVDVEPTEDEHSEEDHENEGTDPIDLRYSKDRAGP